MKKITAIISAVAAICLTACTFDTQIYTRDYVVKPSDWHTVEGSALNTYIYATFPCERITSGVVDNGSVTASIYISRENTWTPLPYIIPFEYQVLDERTGVPTGVTRIVSEVFRYEWAEEEITFIIQDLDGVIPYPPTGDFTIRVNILR